MALKSTKKLTKVKNFILETDKRSQSRNRGQVNTKSIPRVDNVMVKAEEIADINATLTVKNSKKRKMRTSFKKNKK